MSGDPRRAPAAFDAEALRAQFPALHQHVHGRPLVWLDNAATTQKPEAVLRALDHYYRHDNANVHRGVHALSERATAAYEAARHTVRTFLNAAHDEEIVFTRGTTESINLVAQSFLRPRLQPGDRVVVSRMEHHSNIVPWQLVCRATGATLAAIDIDERGELDLDQARALLAPPTRLLAVAHASNALGTVNPVAELCAAAREAGVPVLVDGAQAVAHLPVDVQALGCDFYAFSGHKVFGPTGIGVLWARREHLRAMEPYQGGGEMILEVAIEESRWADPPARFEAGTPHIAGAIGLGAALNWWMAQDRAGAARHEAALLAYATERAEAVPGLRIVGRARHKIAVLGFELAEVHAHDVGTIADRHGVAIRAGHHCAMPAMTRFGVAATARASFAPYNTFADVDRLFEAIEAARRLFTG